MKVEIKHYPRFEKYGQVFPETAHVIVDKIEFYYGYYDDGYVGEVGTTRKWSPKHRHGFKRNNGEPIAITSFGDFGEDCYIARENADVWCEKARKAYEVFTA